MGKEHTTVENLSFGFLSLPRLIRGVANGQEFEMELIGFCTDICVVSNALILKAGFPEICITVDAVYCAGVTLELHSAALK